MLVAVHFQEFQEPRMEPTRVPDPAVPPHDVEPLEWIGLLRSCTAFEAYCKAYTADLHPDLVAEFLVLNPVFPHSIRFSADALAVALKQIGGEVSSRRSSRVER